MTSEVLQSHRCTRYAVANDTELLQLQDHIVRASSQGTVPVIRSQAGPRLNASRTPVVGENSLFDTVAEGLLDPKYKDNPSLSTENGVLKSRKRTWQPWQKLIILNCTLVILALILNIGILILALHKPMGSFESTRLLYKGDCDRTKSIDFWSHMGINILSTAILVGGNYAGQILVAPTREAIDKAHHQGCSLSIGVLGFRNWHFTRRWLKFLTLILFVTTGPLHAIYNAVIYSTISSIFVRAVVVTDDFLSVPPTLLWDQDYRHELFGPNLQGFGGLDTDNSATLALFGLAEDEVFRGNITSFNNLTKSDCWSTFSSTFISDYSAVFYITDLPSSIYNASILHKGVAGRGGRRRTMPTTWSLKFSGYNLGPEVSTVNVTHCLGLKTKPACTVELVPTFLAIVIACNLVKVLVLPNLLCLSIQPLKTIGDAIASFIDFPDPTTNGLCVIGYVLGGWGISAIRESRHAIRERRTPY